MSARTLRIKVSVTDLVAKIEAKKAEIMADYDKAVAEYPKLYAAWSRKIAVHLRAAADAADDGNLKGYNVPYGYGQVGGCIQIPTPKLDSTDYPSKPQLPVAGRMDRDIALLKASADEFITVSADDNLASYL